MRARVKGKTKNKKKKILYIKEVVPRGVGLGREGVVTGGGKVARLEQVVKLLF